MELIRLKNILVAVIEKNIKIQSTNELLDIMASLAYEQDAKKVGMIVYKESLGEKFFNLKTKFAGELLQKFSNYNMSLVIAGDFSEYASSSLKDFIRECNRGRSIFFLPDVQTGIEKYAKLYD